MRFLWSISLVLAGAAAQACPDPPDHSEALGTLLADVQAAESEHQARLISNRMWAFWADAPDEAAQAVLDSGMRKRAAFDLLGAREDFDRLIAYCPEYAEGYNQRAFVNFIRQDYAAALEDLDVALRLSSQHVAAMTGKALALIGLGRVEEGQAVLKQAIGLNPWLPERHLLLPPQGEEL